MSAWMRMRCCAMRPSGYVLISCIDADLTRVQRYLSEAGRYFHAFCLALAVAAFVEFLSRKRLGKVKQPIFWKY